MDNPLISIIIPVYKVEPYLRKCVDSVIAQTYTNLEIILVDDGSPDNCGKICDEYAEKDKRIVVIHKENGGQSDARNAGLDIMKGEYVAFVDSDDYVELDMFEKLSAQANNAEIVMCGIYCDYENKKSKKELLFKEKTNLARMQALQLFFSGKIAGHSFNKLFTKSLFKDIRYPIGQIYEDIPVIRQCLLKANRIIYIAEPLYHYFLHSNSSVSKSGYKDFMRIFEELDIHLKISEDSFNGKFNSEIKGNQLSSAFWVLSRLLKQKNVHRNEAETMKIIIKNNFKYLSYANISKKAKFSCLFIVILDINVVINFYNFLYKFINKGKI